MFKKEIHTATEISKEMFEECLMNYLSEEYSTEDLQVIYKYCTAKLPTRYKVSPSVLYRGLIFSTKGFDLLKEKKSLKLQPKLLTSWTEDREIALHFAERGGAGAVITLTRKQLVDSILCNVDKLFDSGYLEGYESYENEYLVDSTKVKIEAIDETNTVAIIYNKKQVDVDKFFGRSKAPEQERFVITNNNLVEDRKLYVMWSRNILRGSKTWKDAKAYTTSLDYAGYHDWRLPTRVELASLLQKGHSSPYIDKKIFPNTTNIGGYWTSTETAEDKEKVWVIDFGNGRSHPHGKNQSASLRVVRDIS